MDDHKGCCGCGCGGEHLHGHEHSSGHCHDQAHGENCACGHEHVPIDPPKGLSFVQADFLLALRQRRFLPLACFTMTKEGEDGRHMTALAPVYLGSPSDSMEQVKQVGGELSALEEQGLITLDYDFFLKDYPYTEYKTSELYAYFVETVAEAAKFPNPAFDVPKLELGSMALTERGEKMVDELLATPL